MNMKTTVFKKTERFQSMLPPWSWLYMVCFLDLFGASMIVPVFSTHLRSLGISHKNIGLLSSMYSFAQLVSAPVIGSWSDIYGRRTVLCLTMVVCSVCYGLMGVILSFHAFLIVRFALGFLKHTQTLCRACIADVVPKETQTTVLGHVNAFTSFSFMVGPVISGYVMETENGFQCITTFVMLIFLLNVLVAFIFNNYHSKSKKLINENNRVSEKYVLLFQELLSINWKRFWVLLSLKFLFALSFDLFFKNLSIILTENFEIKHLQIGYTISLYGFISVLSNLHVDKIRSLLNVQNSYFKSLAYTLFTAAVTFGWLYTTSSFTQFVVGLVPLACSQVVARVLLTEMLLNESDDDCRGSVMGAFSSVAAIARTVAPLLSGLILSPSGIKRDLIASSLIALSGAAVAVFFSRESQMHDKSL